MSSHPAWSLRAALAVHEPGRGKRYPRELKARVVEHARARRREGASWAAVAEEMGLSFETVRRRCIAVEPKPPRAMVPVRVVAEEAPPTVAVVSAAGHRIKGLTVQPA